MSFLPIGVPGDTRALADVAIKASATQATANDLLSVLNGAVGVLANVFQVVTVLISVLDDAFSDSPDVTELLESLEQSVAVILNVAVGGADEPLMLSVSGILTPARDNLDTLLQFGPDAPEVNEPQFFSSAQNAAYSFVDPTYWIRPYVPGVTFPGQTTDQYLPSNGQPSTTAYAGATWVYDPQIALPAFANGIGIFTSVSAIFNVATPEAIRPYFTDLAYYLNAQYETITQGLVMVPIPSPAALQLLAGMNLNASDGTSLPIGLVSSWHGEIGAVDLYSVFGPDGYPAPVVQPVDQGVELVPGATPGCILSVYPTIGTFLLEVRQTSSNRPDTIPYCYEWFYIRMRIGNLAKLKALYLAKGYGEIWKLIQRLRFLSSGQAGTPEYGLGPVPAAETVDANAHWSLSEVHGVFQELPEAVYTPTPVEVFAGPPPPPPQQPLNIARFSVGQVIQMLMSALDNSVNAPMEEPPAVAREYPRPLSLRQSIINVAI